MEVLAIYLMLGAAAGTLAGLLGVGGGLIIVPVLFEVFTQIGMESSVKMHMAIATSLATILLTSISSTYEHHRHQAVLWSVFWRLTPAILVGAVLGAIIVDYLTTSVLTVCFAVFELFVAYQMWFSIKPKTSRTLLGLSGMLSAGGVIGCISSMIGIGGGTLTVPFLLWCNQGIRKAVATSAACGFPIALASALAYGFLGNNESGVPEQSAGYIYLPAFISISIMSLLFAPLGAKLTHRLPVVMLKKIFAVLLFLLGLRMMMLIVWI